MVDRDLEFTSGPVDLQTLTADESGALGVGRDLFLAVANSGPGSTDANRQLTYSASRSARRPPSPSLLAAWVGQTVLAPLAGWWAWAARRSLLAGATPRRAGGADYHAFRRGMTDAVRVTTCLPVVSPAGRWRRWSVRSG